jgi:hypothetical protein
MRKVVATTVLLAFAIALVTSEPGAARRRKRNPRTTVSTVAVDFAVPTDVVEVKTIATAGALRLFGECEWPVVAGTPQFSVKVESTANGASFRNGTSAPAALNPNSPTTVMFTISAIGWD